MPSQVAAERLKDAELLRGMSDLELRELLQACDDLHFEAGETIYTAGEVQRSLYLLTNGKVELDLEAPALEETAVAALQPYGVFGEASFFHAAPHGVTARCVTAVDVVRLERAALEQLLEKDSRAALRLGANAADILGARLQQTDQWICDLLQAQQDAKIHASWRQFREHLGHSFAKPGGIYPGANFTV